MKRLRWLGWAKCIRCKQENRACIFDKEGQIDNLPIEQQCPACLHTGTLIPMPGGEHFIDYSEPETER